MQITSTFKMLTGEDMISAELKYKNRFSFINNAKLIFSANQLPATYDDSDAYYRRWVILTFPNKFEGTSRNENLLQELTNEKELSGFLNFALEGLRRLLQQRNFSYGISTEKIREEYTRKSDSVRSFFMDCIEAAPAEMVKKDELYSAYVAYCKNGKLPVFGEKSFFTRLRKDYMVEEQRLSFGEERKRIYRGVRFSVRDVHYVHDSPYPILSFPISQPYSIKIMDMKDIPDTKNEKVQDVQDVRLSNDLVLSFLTEDSSMTIQQLSVALRLPDGPGGTAEALLMPILQHLIFVGAIFQTRPGEYRRLN